MCEKRSIPETPEVGGREGCPLVLLDCGSFEVGLLACVTGLKGDPGKKDTEEEMGDCTSQFWQVALRQPFGFLVSGWESGLPQSGFVLLLLLCLW